MPILSHRLNDNFITVRANADILGSVQGLIKRMLHNSVMVCRKWYTYWQSFKAESG